MRLWRSPRRWPGEATNRDEPRADSLEISRFLPSFLGKMAVFDKIEPLVAILSAQFLIHASSSICICLVWRICMMPDALLMYAASASERVLAEPFWKAPRSPEKGIRYSHASHTCITYMYITHRHVCHTHTRMTHVSVCDAHVCDAYVKCMWAIFISLSPPLSVSHTHLNSPPNYSNIYSCTCVRAHTHTYAGIFQNGCSSSTEQ